MNTAIACPVGEAEETLILVTVWLAKRRGFPYSFPPLQSGNEGAEAVGICWGAWSPFAPDSPPLPANVTTCLLAGPSHNPLQVTNLGALPTAIRRDRNPAILFM